MNPITHILVVDDDARIRTMLRRYLSEEGFRVSEAADGAAMRAALERDPADLVLLDLMLPGEDGLSLARHLRESVQVPVIMLSGKADLIDRVVGLEAGADDYITKPFELREVLARIRTVLRRSTPHPAPAHEVAAERGHEVAAFVFQDWRLDLVRRKLTRPGGADVSLTAGEFELLRVFVERPNRVLNREQLMDLVKGREWAANDRAIDTQVGRLRKKVETDPANPTMIKTVRGGGYVFACSVKHAE